MFSKSIVLVALLLVCASSSDDPSTSMAGVVELTTASFRKIVPKKDYLVEFYASWCGWCKRLVPVWEELGRRIGTEHPTVGIAKYDATKLESDDHKATYAVRGFPTILLIKRSGEVVRYSEDRTTEDIIAWLQDQTGAVFPSLSLEDGESIAPSPVVALTPKNFDAVVGDPEKTVFIKFFAPWCGHCIRMADTWKGLAQSLTDVSDVVIAELDAVAHSDQAQLYHVNDFPTLKLFTKTDKSGQVSYRGARDVVAFTTFLKEHGVNIP